MRECDKFGFNFNVREAAWHIKNATNMSSALVRTHIFFCTGRAAEQGIIFRIPTPGQGIIFVKIGSMTGSKFVIFDSERSFRPLALYEFDSNRLNGNISTFFDRVGTNFLAEHNQQTPKNGEISPCSLRWKFWGNEYFPNNFLKVKWKFPFSFNFPEKTSRFLSINAHAKTIGKFRYFLLCRKFYFGTGYHFQEFDSGTV